MSIARKQNIIYVLLILLTIVLTVCSYFYFNQKWLYFRKGETYYQARKFHEAIPYYIQSLHLGKTAKKTYFHLATAYIAEKEFDKAAGVYGAYLQENPDDHEARLDYARALSWAGKLEESQKEYQKLLEKK